MSKKILLFVCLISALVLLLVPVYAQNSNYLIDDANLLNTDEENELYGYLSYYSDLHNLDIVILTTNSTGGKGIMAYADDYFDYNDYGRGSNYNGVIFVIDMGSRNMWISTSGSAINAMTDAGIDLTLDEIYDDIKSANYRNAFVTYIAYVDWLYEKYEAGEPYDVTSPSYSSGPHETNWVLVIILALVIGFIVSLIIVGGWKKQLTPVAMKVGAREYIVNDSFRLTERNDMFLYKTVSRRARPKESSGGGGGSSTHRSSSGRSHGGGGRSF